MKRAISIVIVVLILITIGFYRYDGVLQTTHPNEEKPPTVHQIILKVNSYQSFCWEVEGNQPEIYFLTVHARKIRSCVDCSNESAVLWVEREDGGNFTYQIGPQTNDIGWSAIVNAAWPEINIMNFLRWVLENGNVTGIRREGDHYRLQISLKREEVSNAGTIEDPHMVRTTETWNVTLIVKENGEPLGGRFYGKIRGGSAGVPPVHEGNFTILTVRP